MKKVGFVSLGCPKNLVDTEVMLGEAVRAGYEITAEPADADVIVVNTCGFIASATEESIETILEMARYKTEGRCRRLVVAGCLAQRYAEDIAAELPEVDAIVGLDEVESIVAALGEGDRRTARLRADGSASYLYDDRSPRVLATPGHYAYVKIAEGCDYPCTFCVIPKIRGRFRSRRPESILAEAEALAARGVRELVLVAQDTTRYGDDLGLRGGLARLLRDLATVSGIAWIRLLYAYPTTIGDDVLEAMAELDAVCRYLDLPLQHASDSILKAMKRPGTAESNRRLLERIREAVPGIALRSSFIVGFPGETEDDFARLVDFVEAVELDHVGVFTYSNEAQAEAFVAREALGERVKRSRRRRLLERQAKLSLRRNRRRVGERVRVLVDGPAEETDLLLSGRTEGQAPGIDGAVLINDGTARPGQFVTVEVTEAHPYDLVGRIVPAGETPLRLIPANV